ncbi:MAG: hypothetical protein LBF15_02255 [Candidatus Peribacteria bacterium]|jgi:hypothetical protein|nr:hypothetical protein [Candidatus Peribacteria bacterium]
MKKLVVLIFSIFLFVNTSFADLLPFSEEENSLEIVSIQTGSLTDEQLKIVNASYIYYY